jgi:hypothetical protein
MRCSPTAVNNATLTLSNRVQEMLKDLGFGSLLIMNIKGLEDRVLGAFLLSSVHDNQLCIEVGGHSLPITAQVIHLVSGLPMGNKNFPKHGYHNMTSARSRFMSKSKENTFLCLHIFWYIIIMYHSIYLFKRTKCESKGMDDIFRVDRQKGMSAFKRLSMSTFNPEYDDDWILQCFLVLANNSLLFPTTSLNIYSAYYAPVEDMNIAKKYD